MNILVIDGQGGDRKKSDRTSESGDARGGDHGCRYKFYRDIKYDAGESKSGRNRGKRRHL